jgi:DNA polymerase III subunit alpha
LTRKKAEAAGQFSLFDGAGGGQEAAEELGIDDAPEVPDASTTRPNCSASSGRCSGCTCRTTRCSAPSGCSSAHRRDVRELRERDDGASVVVGGVLTGLTKKFTARATPTSSPPWRT